MRDYAKKHDSKYGFVIALYTQAKTTHILHRLVATEQGKCDRIEAQDFSLSH